MGLKEDIEKIPGLRSVGLALVDYVESLEPGISFELKGKRWVPSQNFVTFTVQHAKARNIVISLRGNPNEFLGFNEIELREGMGHGAYSECTLNSVRQLPAVAMHIRTAHEIYKKGGGRDRKHPEIVQT